MQPRATPSNPEQSHGFISLFYANFYPVGDGGEKDKEKEIRIRNKNKKRREEKKEGEQ